MLAGPRQMLSFDLLMHKLISFVKKTMTAYDFCLLVGCSFMLVSSKYIDPVPEARALIKEGINNKLSRAG